MKLDNESNGTENIGLFDSIESALDSEIYPIFQTVRDKVLETMPNLPSLSQGYTHRMTLEEVKRYQASEKRHQVLDRCLNPQAVDTVFAQ